MIKVLGKGRRERLVPISLECRKHLHWLMTRTSGDLVFKTSSGPGIMRHNAHRDIKRVCRAMGIDGPHVHPLPTLLCGRMHSICSMRALGR